MEKKCTKCIHFEQGKYSYDNWCMFHKRYITDVDECDRFKPVKENELIINVEILGCDDSTYIRMNATKEEVEFLERLSKLSKEISTYQCMPTIRVNVE